MEKKCENRPYFGDQTLMLERILELPEIFTDSDTCRVTPPVHVIHGHTSALSPLP